ncbi:MAG: hypothetical protein JSW48_05415 [Betaproteobacteria bacterium]|jgi:hypothetical protein|nr:MAG: hypothetical protein JSW48_05415 [Betaproteobacteria bacterium]
MLSSLLRTIEQGFGPLLSSAGDIAFLLGLLMLVYVILAPSIRILVEMQAANIGIEREWIMHCMSCRRMTVVAGSECEHCGHNLGIPWAVRLRQFFSRGGEPRWLEVTRWIYTSLGVIAFTLITVVALGVSGAWNPQSHIEKLFVGLSLLTWAGLGWLLGRVFGIGTGGPISRVRDTVFSLALAALLLTTTTLASAARPVEEAVVAQVRVDGQVAQLGSRATALVGYQLGLEYLHVEHAFAGFRHATPLAIIGTRRLELPLGERQSDVVDFLWKHSVALTERGLAVRKRTDQFMVAESGIYEIVLRGDKLSIRRFASPS